MGISARKAQRRSGAGARIVTLTLSPALDIATQVARLCADAKLRCSTPVYAPGGGGINVARAIHALGGSALALFPAGGSSGQHLVELLEAEGVASQVLAIADWTRECFNVVEQASAQQYRFIMPGARLAADEQVQLLAALQALPADYLVISGSLPEGLADDLLPRLLRDAARRGVRCILDSSGEALRQALDVGGIFMIKPNLNELNTLVGGEIGSPQQLASAARQLVRDGRCQTLLVSLGAQGALLVREGLSERIAAPTVRRRSTVGAGDSLVAAVTLKLAAGADWLEAARYGVAAGSAAIMAEGSGLCRREDTEQLYAWLQAYAGD
ncbi:6-phosphofructokinase II [Pseudomonas zhanjiangensis]|uniref:Phosphofructokinase n=1 Tax=Pseudomonas zhanjiangensis TaxID=3239015 RepID=A0ABV3YZH1_9PSED